MFWWYVSFCLPKWCKNVCVRKCCIRLCSKVILLPKNVVLLFCAVSNVSCSVNGFADDGHRAGSGLWKSFTSVLETLEATWNLWPCYPTRALRPHWKGQYCLLGSRWQRFRPPMWARIQLGAEDHLQEGWWGLGQMAGPITFRGSTTSTRWRRYQCTAGEGRHRGAQAEKLPRW